VYLGKETYPWIADFDQIPSCRRFFITKVCWSLSSKFSRI